ncbi:MAG: dicarboxylate/amino acid:cation symporter [Planctomycetota bacterium]
MTRLPLHWEILFGMLLGASLGVGCNVFLGKHKATVPREHLPDGIAGIIFNDTTDRVEIRVISEDDGVRKLAVDPTRLGQEGVFATIDKLAKKHPAIAEQFEKYGRSRARWIGQMSQRIGNLFLRLLRMVSIPLIITSLVSGVMGLGEASQVGRMFARTVLYYVTTSLLAITSGLLMVNMIRPGLKSELGFVAGEKPEVGGNLSEILFQQLETMIPPNPFAALAEANFLSIISFSLAFAIFATLVGGRVAERLRDLFNDGFQVMMKITMAIIQLAPAGVLFLMLYATATQGPEVFQSLAWYMLAVLCALAAHALIVLPLILKFVAKRDPFPYFQAMSPALLTAFSSASSNGTLPLTLACAEERGKISNRVSSFVLPLGATVNMDGTALYEAVAVLFIAQLHFGTNLPLDTQIIVALTALLASIGAAGIPHAGLVMMVIILQAVDLPIEMQGIIIAVDRVLDMCRTAVNVWSDSTGCAVVARWETTEALPGG